VAGQRPQPSEAELVDQLRRAEAELANQLRRATGRGGVPAQRTALIRGRVFAGDTGVPLRRALVSAQGGGRPVVGQTDFDGRFELEVPPGRWNVAAAKAGYVTLRLGQRRSFESVPPVEIGPGHRMDNADFVLPRGSAISGRVFDELGDPVLDARVRVLRYQMVRGRKQLSSAGISVTTDDRGMYRLYGLPPGQYYVSARAETRPIDRGDEQPMKYANTFYPGTADIADARRIAVDVGDEQNDVNFLLRPVRAARVSGTVIDAAGAPLAGGSISLLTAFDSSDGDLPLGASAGIQRDGSFTLRDVIPGSYTLVARSRPGRGADGNERPTMAYVPLVIPDDLDDVVVTATAGATINGTFADAGGGQPPGDRVSLTAQPLNSAIGFGRLTAQANDDGTFTMDGLIGPVVLRPAQLPSGWRLDRIEVNGVDVTDTFLEFTGTERALARVVLTKQIPEVKGWVRADRHSPSGYHVVLFPADQSKWTYPSRFVMATRSREDGTFSVRALPPHDRYLAVAVDYLEDDEATDPDFLQAIRGSATPFALRDAEEKVLDLPLVER
jgi:hypothetical protein